MLGKDPARALTPENINSFWTLNHEHPPVEKIWSGLVWLGARHFFDELSANRLGPILMVAFLIALLYLMVAKEYGRGAGLFAAAALMSMPRFFFHSHLAALDVPVAVGSIRRDVPCLENGGSKRLGLGDFVGHRLGFGRGH